jgi:hypothetical protein
MAIETRLFAEQLGPVPCTTPSYSPQSNGMSEAFVKTFKRDYAYLSGLPDARRVFEPHKGLRMKSPRQVRRLNLSAQAVRLAGGNSSASSLVKAPRSDAVVDSSLRRHVCARAQYSGVVLVPTATASL